MTNIQTIHHVDDCVPLYLPHSLYLKPLARLNISVALPVNKTGKSISNLDIMEKLSSALKPDKFFVLKVAKNTIDFVRFEAELENRARLKAAIARLDGCTLKISGFNEPFKVRATETKDDFPTRHDWDSFFRDASHMDEMKAGERPDTIHLTHLPIRWFCPRHAEQDENVKPSESIFKRIFEKFGCVRCVDIPICDPYRNKMNSDINGMKTFSSEQDVLFEAYVQFDEYVGFTRAMDEFRGMKLVRKYVDKTLAINITVNFDKTKHLSDAQSQRRERVRTRLIAKARAEEENKEQQKRLELEKLERIREKEQQEKFAELEKQREREEKRKQKHMKKIQERGQVEISQEIRVEERKLMIAQRKLESIRVLEALFARMRTKHIEQSKKSSRHAVDAAAHERELARVRLVDKYKVATENLLSEQKEKVEELKSKTPLLGLLSKKSRKHHTASSDDDEKHDGAVKRATPAAGAGEPTAVGNISAIAPVNPFRTVAALAAAGSAAATSTYNTEAASEWMKSLSMFPYVSPMFPHAALYRPTAGNFGVSPNYRGFAPRIRGRGRGRGIRGARGGYNGQSSSYYNNYKNYKYDDDGGYDDYDGSDDDYRRSSYSKSGRNRSRSRRSYSRRRSTSRSRSRDHSRSRRSHSRRSSHSSRSSRDHSHTKRSRSHSSRSNRNHSRTRRSYSRRRQHSHSRDRSRGSRSRSRSHSETKTQSQGDAKAQTIQPHRLNKKLVSTRRSRSTNSEWSQSRSRSRSRSRSSRSHSRRVVIETDKLVRSAEEIKRTIEKNMQERMREEEREIKQNFRHRRKHEMSPQMNADRDSAGTAVISTAHSPIFASGDSNKERTTNEMECDAYEDHNAKRQDEDI